MRLFEPHTHNFVTSGLSKRRGSSRLLVLQVLIGATLNCAGGRLVRVTRTKVMLNTSRLRVFLDNWEPSLADSTSPTTLRRGQQWTGSYNNRSGTESGTIPRLLTFLLGMRVLQMVTFAVTQDFPSIRTSWDSEFMITQRAGPDLLILWRSS